MLLDDLVTAIQTVQARIREHGNSLSQNEYRTRISLIDPILNALGWDVSNPALVTIEDQYSGGRPDYGLLGNDRSKPLAFVEAKRLDEPLDAHHDQVFKYTWDRRVFYAVLTDGNQWIVRDVAAEFSRPPRKGLLLDLNISTQTAQNCALRLLLLWHQTFAEGEPIRANEPILVAPSEPAPLIVKSNENQDASPSDEGWLSLTDFVPVPGTPPPNIWLPDTGEIALKHWYGVLVETTKWLVREGSLTEQNCPVETRHGASIVYTTAKLSGATNHFDEVPLSNGLFLNKHGNRTAMLHKVLRLLQHCNQDPASILLKPG